MSAIGSWGEILLGHFLFHYSELKQEMRKVTEGVVTSTLATEPTESNPVVIVPNSCRLCELRNFWKLKTILTDIRMGAG